MNDLSVDTLARPDPEGAPLLASSRARAVAVLARRMCDREVLTLLAGQAGVGKSFVLNAALAALAGDAIRVIRLSNPSQATWSQDDLADRLLQGRTAPASAAQAGTRAIAELTSESDGSQVVIAIDDAHTMTDDAMEMLLTIASPARGDSPPPQLVLAGRGTFWQRRWRSELQLLHAKLVTLEPLAGAEAAAYVALHLRRDGGSVSDVSPGAMSAILRYSGGLPGRINHILPAAISIGVARGGQVLSRHIVKSAIASLAPGEPHDEGLSAMPARTAAGARPPPPKPAAATRLTAPDYDWQAAVVAPIPAAGSSAVRPRVPPAPAARAITVPGGEPGDNRVPAASEISPPARADEAIRQPRVPPEERTSAPAPDAEIAAPSAASPVTRSHQAAVREDGEAHVPAVDPLVVSEPSAESPPVRPWQEGLPPQQPVAREDGETAVPVPDPLPVAAPFAVSPAAPPRPMASRSGEAAMPTEPTARSTSSSEPVDPPSAWSRLTRPRETVDEAPRTGFTRWGRGSGRDKDLTPPKSHIVTSSVASKPGTSLRQEVSGPSQKVKQANGVDPDPAKEAVRPPGPSPIVQPAGDDIVRAPRFETAARRLSAPRVVPGQRLVVAFAAAAVILLLPGRLAWLLPEAGARIADAVDLRWLRELRDFAEMPADRPSSPPSDGRSVDGMSAVAGISSAPGQDFRASEGSRATPAATLAEASSTSDSHAAETPTPTPAAAGVGGQSAVAEPVRRTADGVATAFKASAPVEVTEVSPSLEQREGVRTPNAAAPAGVSAGVSGMTATSGSSEASGTTPIRSTITVSGTTAATGSLNGTIATGETMFRPVKSPASAGTDPAQAPVDIVRGPASEAQTTDPRRGMTDGTSDPARPATAEAPVATSSVIAVPATDRAYADPKLPRPAASPHKRSADGRPAAPTSVIAGATSTSPAADPGPLSDGGKVASRSTQEALPIAASAGSPPSPAPAAPATAVIASSAIPVPGRDRPSDGSNGATQPSNAAVAQARPPSGVSLTPEAVASLLRRGKAMLSQGDVLSARLLFERAAAAGSAEGAIGAGKTYDPAFLATIDAPGLKSDHARAIAWYRTASATLGEREADARSNALTPQTDQ